MSGLTEEMAAQLASAHDRANKSIYAHNLASQAFNVAVARFDWKLAAKEQELALSALSENMDAIQAIHRIREQM
jgi:hypothetical protein